MVWLGVLEASRKEQILALPLILCVGLGNWASVSSSTKWDNNWTFAQALL